MVVLLTKAQLALGNLAIISPLNKSAMFLRLGMNAESEIGEAWRWVGGKINTTFSCLKLAHLIPLAVCDHRGKRGIAMSLYKSRD